MGEGDRILLAHFVSILRVTPTSISKQVIKSKKKLQKSLLYDIL